MTTTAPPGAEDPVGRLLLRLGLKPHQLPAARRWLAAGLLGLLVLLAFDLYDSVAAPPDGQDGTPVLGTAARVPAGTEGPGAADGIALWTDRLNRDLAGLLRQVQGAGEVAVYVRLDGGPRQSVAQDVRTTTRTAVDTDERLRREQTEREENVQTVLGGGGGQPVVTALSSPEVLGVLILADGAASSDVRWRLLQAAAGALGLPAHRVEIVTREAQQR